MMLSAAMLVCGLIIEHFGVLESTLKSVSSPYFHLLITLCIKVAYGVLFLVPPLFLLYKTDFYSFFRPSN